MRGNQVSQSQCYWTEHTCSDSDMTLQGVPLTTVTWLDGWMDGTIHEMAISTISANDFP